MEIHSLGYRTDLIFPRFDGQILDRGSYLVIRTPTNPTYYWGNFLLFADPPGKGDLECWKSIFAREIGLPPQVEHYAFGWDTTDGTTGLVQPFLDDGFHLSQSWVLTARQVNPPPRVNREVAIRPLSEDWEWQQAGENQVLCRQAGHSEAEFRRFKGDQMRRFRRMALSGRGQWFGAFLEGRLVADLGVFADGPIGRFQDVGTHPDYRRRGICGTLVHQASLYAFEKMQVETLVMVADEHYFAAKIYESVGFQPSEHQVGLDWWNQSS